MTWHFDVHRPCSHSPSRPASAAMISFGGSVLGAHRHGCVGSLAAWQHDYNGDAPPPQPRATALLQPRAAAAAALCHRRCSFMPPPLQPRATTAANTAAALCHRCCSLVPPPLVQPGPSLAPCCRSCLQHHHSFNLISPLTSQPQHVSTRATSPRQHLASCQDSLLPAAASCAAAAVYGIWSMPYSRDRRSAALKRLSGDLPGWTAF